MVYGYLAARGSLKTLSPASSEREKQSRTPDRLPSEIPKRPLMNLKLGLNQVVLGLSQYNDLRLQLCDDGLMLPMKSER